MSVVTWTLILDLYGFVWKLSHGLDSGLSIDIDKDPEQFKNSSLIVKLQQGATSTRYVCLFVQMSINKNSLNST